jgi:hypothetical protein
MPEHTASWGIDRGWVDWKIHAQRRPEKPQIPIWNCQIQAGILECQDQGLEGVNAEDRLNAAWTLACLYELNRTGPIPTCDWSWPANSQSYHCPPRPATRVGAFDDRLTKWHVWELEAFLRHPSVKKSPVATA